MKLITIYQQQVEQGKIKHDAQQVEILQPLQRVFDNLVQIQEKTFLTSIKNIFNLNKKNNIKGLYLWGNVGVGKTFLMDIFFNSLPIKRKLRLHFHVFMQQVHHHLQRLQGHPDPLQFVARHFAMRAQVLCFDEFFVNDITDAMLLGRLFDALFARGITLITTSNQAPDDLYKDGLQRKLFLPTIELLKQRCEIIACSNTTDYRLRTLTQAGVYFYPLNEISHAKLQDYFELYAHGSGHAGMPLVINARPIATVMQAHNVVWFEFSAICNAPRSQLDYIALSHKFKVIIISGVPQISDNEQSSINYFINLVDVFYDNHIQLILSAEVVLEELYPAGERDIEFKRTLSRLIEMQSVEYLSSVTIKSGR